MKKLFFACLFTLINQTTFAQSTLADFAHTVEPERFEGDKPYTPTRIEWLVAEGRNECGFWLGGIPGASYGLFNVIGEKNKDTIKISVRFSDEKVRTEAQKAAETCARNIRAVAGTRGWTWVKTVVEVFNKNSALNSKGFQISSIPLGGTGLARLGLMKDDILKTINYQPVYTAEDVLRIDGLVKSKKTVRVEYIRAGHTKLKILEQ